MQHPAAAVTLSSIDQHGITPIQSQLWEKYSLGSTRIAGVIDLAVAFTTNQSINQSLFIYSIYQTTA